MLQTEYVKNLNCNYERIRLDEKPEENRYQYCIVTRGGMKGILPCSLRYINGDAYLYYDISSTQSVEQLYINRSIDRRWIKDFLWSMERIHREMDRFLLDNSHLLWYPEQIYQDLERREFFFLYVPYYQGETGFGKLLEFLIEHLDYNDEKLAECIYKMHEQYMSLGDVYLSEQIYEEGKKLEQTVEVEPKTKQKVVTFAADQEGNGENEQTTDGQTGRRGIRYFLEEKWKKPREEKEYIYHVSGRSVEYGAGSAKNEVEQYSAVRDVDFSEEKEVDEKEAELGKTIYMEKEQTQEEMVRGLYTEQGELVAELCKQSMILGKKKDEVDCVLEDSTVSRMHARISVQKDNVYLEDMNSTNGTSKNGLRLQPYEKRRLEPGDEIRMGKTILYFR